MTRSGDNTGTANGRKLKLLTVAELEALPDPKWLIDGIIPEGGIVLLYGPSGVGKSFLGLDMALSAVAGRQWCGRDVQQGDAVYIYAEGQSGLKNRITAWQRRHGGDLRAFRCLPQPLHIAANHGEFVAAIKRSKLRPQLIVIDTLARCFGDADENSTKDMSAFVTAVDKVRAMFPCATVVIVHHTGKDSAKRDRGSSALRAAADTVMSLVGVGNKLTLGCDKQKDAEKFASIPLRLDTVTLKSGTTSCVVSLASGPQKGEVPGDPRASKNDQRVLEALDRIGTAGASFSAWQRAAELPKSTFKDTLSRLISVEKVVKRSRRYFVANSRPKAETGTEQGQPALALLGREVGAEQPPLGGSALPSQPDSCGLQAVAAA